MESTVSVSKGVFLFRNGFKKMKKPKKNVDSTFFKLYCKAPWYETFKTNWRTIEQQIEDLHYKTYSVLLNDIVTYIKSFHHGDNSVTLEGIVPSATLLTGVNQPDHVSQFSALYAKIEEEVTPLIAMINSQDAPTVRHLVENVVGQLCNENRLMVSDSDEEMETNFSPKKKIVKSQCTMKFLQSWYHNRYGNVSLKKRTQIKSLVIIIPDFECFNCSVLQDFVLIVSSYVTSLPIVFVFGVATSVSALHKSFPYHVSSKLLIKVFHSHSSPVYMNQVLENVFLTHTSPFHLSGKAFELLTDVFLFYDFSVTGLVQSIKYCMMDHYYGDNIKSLCCERDKLKVVIRRLTSDELENIRRLLSFRPYAEAQDSATKIALFENDDFFRDTLLKQINNWHDYLYCFYTCVRLLTEFVKDLPRNVFGKTVRELYTKCAQENVTESNTFKDCMQLIKFQSQVKLVETITNAVKIVNTVLQTDSLVKPLRSSPTKNNMNNMTMEIELGKDFIKKVRVHLLTFLRQIEAANTESIVLREEATDSDDENTPGSRYMLKQKLLKATKVDRLQSEFEMIRSRFVSYLEDMFAKGLRPPHTQTFHEIFMFSDVLNVKKHIVGSPRGALHTALSNPVHYLQCSCCHLPSPESISDSLPDVCVAYKLHRECGKHINLYDWLQAFAAVLLPEVDDDQRHQDPHIQARFTSAVAELQFLGFIKSSKRKTDHVMRLTW